MNTFKIIARIFFGIPFFVFGINHFIYAENMVNIVPQFIPGGIFWVYLTGLGLILASISFIINKLVHISGILLAIMLLIFVLTIHLPGLFDANRMQMAMLSMLKDISLASGSLFIALSDKNCCK